MSRAPAALRDCSGLRSRRCVTATICARLLTPSARKIDATWVLTVFGEMFRRRQISFVVSPSARSSAIWRWRSVSDCTAAAVAAEFAAAPPGIARGDSGGGIGDGLRIAAPRLPRMSGGT